MDAKITYFQTMEISQFKIQFFTVKITPTPPQVVVVTIPSICSMWLPPIVLTSEIIPFTIWTQDKWHNLQITIEIAVQTSIRGSQLGSVNRLLIKLIWFGDSILTIYKLPLIN